jgi:hypothetical protein
MSRQSASLASFCSQRKLGCVRFGDQDMLHVIELARFLIGDMIPCRREAR